MGPKIALGSCLALLGALFAVREVWAPRACVCRGSPSDPAAAGHPRRGRESQAAASPAGDAEEDGPASVECPEAWPYTGCNARRYAAYELADSGRDGAAVLHAALAHPRPAVRAAAASAWVVDVDQLRRVEALLDDGDATVRFAAGLTLCWIASDRSDGARAQRLRAASLPADVIVSRLAAWPRASRADAMRILALALAGDAPSAPALFARLPGLGGPVVDLLRELLRAPEVRRDAMRALGRCEALAVPFASELSPALYERMDDKIEAALALLRLGCRLDEALVVLAEDRPSSPDAEWRPFVPLLRKALAGKGPIPVESALSVVEGMGPEAADCLPDVLLLRESVEPDRLICVLARMGSAAKEALPWLLTESRRPDHSEPHPLFSPRTEFQVFKPLTYGPEPSLRSVFFLSDGAEPSTPAGVALRGAAEVAPRDPEVVREALARLDDPEPDVRHAATLALRHALAEGDIPPDGIVARLVHDQHEYIRRAAASVLGFAAPRRQDVVSRLAALLETGDGFSKEHAARALKQADATAALSDALESEDVGARTWAAAMLLLRWYVLELTLFLPDPSEDALDSAPETAEEEPWHARAVAVIEASVRADDPALRRLAVHVMAVAPGFPRWHDAAEIASRDPDELVRGTASAFLERWHGVYVQLEPLEIGGWARERADTAARTLLGEAWVPVDVALLAEEGEIDPGARRTLGVISCDTALSAFERWAATEALRTIEGRK